MDHLNLDSGLHQIEYTIVLWAHTSGSGLSRKETTIATTNGSHIQFPIELWRQVSQN